jgi:TRAP-type mannitol/chloroaromatic compound transport system permease small subunit
MSTVKKLQATVSVINRINETCGRMVSWLTLAMVLVTFAVVVLRYLFNMGWIAMQETITYMHALVFMLGVAYTLKRGGHVRVDIFYHKFSQRRQAWVNLLGTLLFLLPTFGFILWVCWDYVLFSWSLQEHSQEAGGLPFLYLLKSVLLLMPVLMLLQGVAILAENLLILLGHVPATEDQNGVREI